MIRGAFREEVGLESSTAGQEGLDKQGGIHSRDGKYFKQRYKVGTCMLYSGDREEAFSILGTKWGPNTVSACSHGAYTGQEDGEGQKTSK